MVRAKIYIDWGSVESNSQLQKIENSLEVAAKGNELTFDDEGERYIIEIKSNVKEVKSALEDLEYEYPISVRY